MFKKFMILFAALAAFFYSTAAASVSPCESDPMFERVHSYFVFRWQAQYQDLTPVELSRFLSYEGIATSVALGRVYRSVSQPKLAVLLARSFTNYLNDSKFVEVLCVIKAQNGDVVRTYHPQELFEILNAGSDT